MVVGRAKPRRGFVSTSAYLAVPLSSFDFIILHICCQICVIVYTSRW